MCARTQCLRILIQAGEFCVDCPTMHVDFGWSVAVAGSTAVVGAELANSKAGAAYVFVRSRGKWSQQAKLTAPHL